MANKDTAVAEIVDSRKEFKWRIVRGDEYSPWYKDYEGLLVHTFSDGRTFGLATHFWSGSLPEEKPFEIVAC